MKTTLIFIVACAVLTGCAAQVVASSSRSVMVKAVQRQSGEAQALADAECAKHQRFARMSARPNFDADQHTFVFDCVQ